MLEIWGDKKICEIVISKWQNKYKELICILFDSVKSPVETCSNTF